MVTTEKPSYLEHLIRETNGFLYFPADNGAQSALCRGLTGNGYNGPSRNMI